MQVWWLILKFIHMHSQVNTITLSTCNVYNRSAYNTADEVGPPQLAEACTVLRYQLEAWRKSCGCLDRYAPVFFRAVCGHKNYGFPLHAIFILKKAGPSQSKHQQDFIHLQASIWELCIPQSSSPTLLQTIQHTVSCEFIHENCYNSGVGIGVSGAASAAPFLEERP